MQIAIKCAECCLNVLFSCMKLLKVKKKITYISRQMDTTPLDFQLVIDEFRRQDDSYEHVVLAKMIPKGILGKLSYCFHMLVQMYHIATSEAVILDTYCIAVSLLKQRKSLVVIQMWHAVGAFKKFGYSILDQEEGSSSKVAKMMKMHENYTYVLSSSEFASPFFAEAFHVEQSKMRIYPLPKTDLLLDDDLRKKILNRIYDVYPNLRNTSKKVIVYAPTFRKEANSKNEMQKAIDELIEKLDFERYELVVKKHVLSEFEVKDSRVIVDEKFTSLEFFYMADVIVTDYSAVLFEALFMEKPIYFYAFDCQTYMKKRDFYIDYFTDLPGRIETNAQGLIEAIEAESVDYNKIKQFREKMIAPCKKGYTKDFVEFLRKSIDKDTKELENNGKF